MYSNLCFIFFAAIAIAGLSGCRGGTYRARSLPPEYAAPIARSAQQLDLSSLARSQKNVEVIYARDVLQVTIDSGLGAEEVKSWDVHVSEEGLAEIPVVGAVKLGGLKTDHAEQLVSTACRQRRLYRSPRISIAIKTRGTNQVAVIGAVKNPDSYDLPVGRSDLLTALISAGGLETDADTIVEIRHPRQFARPNQHASELGRAGSDSPIGLASYQGGAKPMFQPSQQIDLEAVHPQDGQDYSLEDGSVVMVRKKPPGTIRVMGLVRRPGEFTLPRDRDLRLLDALALAGDRELQFADRVRIVRQVPGENRAIIMKTSVSAAKRNSVDNPRLAPGDVVSVDETPLTFVATELRKYIRIGISATSRVAIPSF